MRTAMLGRDVELDTTGSPASPVRVIDLDEWADADPREVATEAARCAGSLQVTIGCASARPAPALAPLTDALTLTLVPTPAGPVPVSCVPVADVEEALALLAAAVTERPRSALALGQLLRQTPGLPTLPALAAEAATYSMLLGGPEFASWLNGRGAPRAGQASDAPLVLIERDDDRLRLTLDRPGRRNALGAALREELVDALELAVLDDTITRVELSAAGPSFCSGGDLDEFGSASDLVAAYLVRLERAPWRLIDQIADRVEVRVHGAAVGAGVEMAAFAGRVRCTPDAFFCLPELGMGLVPGAGGSVSVPRRIGRWRTAWMVLSGVRVDAGTAYDWGLVDEIEGG